MQDLRVLNLTRRLDGRVGALGRGLGVGDPSGGRTLLNDMCWIYTLELKSENGDTVNTGALAPHSSKATLHYTSIDRSVFKGQG